MADVLSPADLERLAGQVAEAVADRLARRPLLVDRVELAPMIGLSVPTIERRTRTGEIPCVRSGRRVLYDPRAVVDAMATKTKGGADHGK